MSNLMLSLFCFGGSAFIECSGFTDGRGRMVYFVAMKSDKTVVHCATEDEMPEMYESGVDLFFGIETYLKK